MIRLLLHWHRSKKLKQRVVQPRSRRERIFGEDIDNELDDEVRPYTGGGQGHWTKCKCWGRCWMLRLGSEENRCHQCHQSSKSKRCMSHCSDSKCKSRWPPYMYVTTLIMRWIGTLVITKPNRDNFFSSFEAWIQGWTVSVSWSKVQT